MTSLSLPLLVFRVGANYPNHSAAMNHLTLVTNLFHASPNFHAFPPLLTTKTKLNPPQKRSALLVAVHDAAARQVVRRKLDGHFVPRENADEILGHLSGDVRQPLVLVLQLHAEH